MNTSFGPRIELTDHPKVDYEELGIKNLMPSELLCRVKERYMRKTRVFASITRHNTPTSENSGMTVNPDLLSSPENQHLP